MLYVFTGTDIEKMRDSVLSLISAKREKKMESDYVRIDDTFERDFVEYINMQGLFGQKTIIFLDGAPEKKKFQKYLKDVVCSPNLFFLVEQKIDKKILTAMKDLDVSVKEYNKRAEVKNSNEIFSVANALLSKDKVKFFVSVWALQKKGFTLDEILGVVGWQIRSLLSAWDASSAQEAGLSPFVYTKSKKAIGSFEKERVLCAFDIFNISFGKITIQKEKELYFEKAIFDIVNALYE